MTTNADPGSAPVYPRHIPSIPYSDSGNRLQTLDIWLPRPLEQSDPTNSIWIVYIHGGAWRDPTQDARCVEPTIKHLSSPFPPKIAGIASLNYRLSPYSTHPTDPSSPTDPNRTAQHPTHVRDIALGLEYLAQNYGVKRWIGVGHSCGATLLLQHVAGIGIDHGNTTRPESLILIAGIYNIPLLLANHVPPACPAPIAAIYASFIAGAFGADASAYLPASPVAGKYSTQTWPEGRLMILAHSYDDELIERAQRDVMCVALDRQGWSIVMEDGDEEREGGRVLEVRDLKGGHDWIWEDGGQIARLVGEVVERLG
ncbi:alpha/beta-hydrolase [Dothidotthia symphoricarpi CBS 119687]|uniref:Kynurenine formamidase n=1 Tax=Dothidotthia symphoricarpi CBS 119687 TaxID=1392245 RepID=A0A6A6AH75_9PLEO|nr:alpha/beta-hydrolase [Dothidotthia symphoricarpi CBS 119687]KAF2131342.1 alpha/beta-hydrolase [Dothidotthia symphoricarpi CBS 119687]